MSIFSQKIQKNYFGSFWGLFAQIWAKVNFPETQGSVSF